MRKNHLWNRAKEVKIQTGAAITGGFSVGFDESISEDTKDALMQFLYWVEDNFSVPVTLWVDFRYRHYLMRSGKGRVPYKFYWVDFETYPVFEAWDDIPVIELPIRTEHCTQQELLRALIQAISDYYIWLGNGMFDTADADIETVLQAYLADIGVE